MYVKLWKENVKNERFKNEHFSAVKCLACYSVTLITLWRSHSIMSHWWGNWPEHDLAHCHMKQRWFGIKSYFSYSVASPLCMLPLCSSKSSGAHRCGRHHSLALGAYLAAKGGQSLLDAETWFWEALTRSHSLPRRWHQCHDEAALLETHTHAHAHMRIT